MSKVSKVLIVLSSIGLLVTICLIQITKNEKSVDIPASSLVYSIFEAQNNTYMESSSLPNVYSCNYVPFTVDVPAGEVARIGDGAVYKVNDNSYIYITEIAIGTELNGHMMKELPKALMYDYSLRESEITEIAVDSGYINGFSADYFVKGLTINDAMHFSTTTTVAVGYQIKLSKDGFDHDIVIIAASNLTNSDGMNSCKKALDTTLYTIRYNSDLKDAIDERKYIEYEEMDWNVEGSDMIEDAQDGVQGNSNDESLYDGYSVNSVNEADSVTNADVIDKNNYSDDFDRARDNERDSEVAAPVNTPEPVVAPTSVPTAIPTLEPTPSPIPTQEPPVAPADNSSAPGNVIDVDDSDD